MTNGSESNTSLLQDDKLKKHLEKFSCDVDYLELKKFTNQELRAKAAEMKELTQQTEAKTLEVLAETNELNEKINTLESSTEIHRLLVNAVAEV